MQRIGILGGTFNPPHLGHLALARHARLQLDLDHVLLMPANHAPNKPAVKDDPGPEHRLRMCRLAVAEESGVETSALEIERGGTSYTVVTVQAIHDSYPDAELTLIVGADTALTLPGWREPARLLEMTARVAVAQRDGSDLGEIKAALDPLLASSERGAEPGQHLITLRMTPVAISSSLVRRRVLAGEPVVELVGDRVSDYIAKHGLYRTQSPATSVGGGAA
ncbi:MAG TPA: nicotinate-nucleotide adenylyltransferase [Solirubrobacteraceae bacterium]